MNHRLYRTGPLIGKNFKEIIDPLDVTAIDDTVKKVINENTHAFIAYSIFRALSFIALLAPRGDNIFCFELASSPTTDKQVQKNMLLKSASGLLPGLKIGFEDEMRTIN